jgi:hypothetical protein
MSNVSWRFAPRASDINEVLRWRNVRRYGIYYILILTTVIRILVMSTFSLLVTIIMIYKNHITVLGIFIYSSSSGAAMLNEEWKVAGSY